MRVSILLNEPCQLSSQTIFTDLSLAVKEEPEWIDAICHSTTYHREPMEYYRRLIGVLKENLLHDCRESSKHKQHGNCGNDVHCREIHLIEDVTV